MHSQRDLTGSDSGLLEYVFECADDTGCSDAYQKKCGNLFQNGTIQTGSTICVPSFECGNEFTTKEGWLFWIECDFWE